MKLVADKKAHVIMKGLVNSAVFLKAALKKDYGVRGSGLLSHVALFFPKFFYKPFVITDAALNLFPTLEEKIVILRNAVAVLHKLGVEKPKVALLAHNEVPSEKVPASLDAQRIKETHLKGEFPDCVIDGPLALDLAISREACLHKGVKSEVGGDPDLLLCPDILSGNILYKALAFMVKALCAAVIVGADVPMVMTSRAESAESKLLSVALASTLAD
jgi:phosphate butyryltransferase